MKHLRTIKKKINFQGTKKISEQKMFVPENKDQRHAVSMFLATAGAAGQQLGSDEKEIIYLVFGVFDLQSKEVSDQQNCKWSAFH